MPTDQKSKIKAASQAAPSAAVEPPPGDTLTDPLASWVLPSVPKPASGEEFIRPYSNVNPFNPMAAEMEALEKDEPIFSPNDAVNPLYGKGLQDSSAQPDEASVAPSSAVRFPE